MIEIPMAKEAIVEWVEQNEGTPMREMFDHFFPPSTLPFNRDHMRAALQELLWRGEVHLDEERKLRLP